MANRNRVTIVINADGSAAIESFGQVGEAAGKTQEDLEKKTEGLTSRIKRHWLGMTAAVTGAVLAAGKAWDLAEQAAKYEQSRQAFKSMVAGMGLDAQIEFAKIKTASAGLIDNKTLTEAANRAMSLGIGIENLGNLMNIARAKARDMGISTTQAFDDIVTGIGRGSPMIIDNLGLTLKIGEANEAYAKSLKKTVEQLTAQEKKQAILNAVLEAGTEAVQRHNLEVLTTAERMEKLRATVENLKLQVGALVIRVGVGLVGAFETVKAMFVSVGAAIVAPIALLEKALNRLGITSSTVLQDTLTEQLRIVDESAASARDNFAAMIAKSEELASVQRQVPRPDGEDAAEQRRKELDAIRQVEAAYTAWEFEQKMARDAAMAEVERADFVARYEQKVYEEQAMTEVEAAYIRQRFEQQQKAEQAKKRLRADTINHFVGLLQVLGARSKAAAIAGIAITKAMEVAKTIQTTFTAATLAFASQVIPGDPTSLIRAAAAAASVKAWGFANAALIAATGLAQIAGMGSTPPAPGGTAGEPMPVVPVEPSPASMAPEERGSTKIINYHFYGTVIGDLTSTGRVLAPLIRQAEEDGF